MRPSLIRRFAAALAVPLGVIVLVSVDGFLAARKTEYLLARADLALGQIAVLDSLSASLNTTLLDVVLTEDGAGARAALVAFERQALHALGVLDQLTEQEIDFVEEDERETESEERSRPALLRSSLEDVLAKTNALLDLRLSAEISVNASAGFAAMNGARASFAALIAEAIADERAEVSTARSAHEQSAGGVTWRSAAVSLAAIALTLALAVPLALSMLRRWRRLAAFLTRLADGQLDGRLTRDRNDELGVLEEAAATLAERLAAAAARKAAADRDLADTLHRRTSELELSNARLREVDATRRRLLGDIGHALKTPLAVARGTVENAQTKIGDANGERDSLERALTAIDSVTNRVAALLRLARADDGRLMRHETRIELADLLDQVVAKARILPHADRVSLKLEPLDPVLVLGDPHELERAFTAVLENAMQHGGKDGPIRITLSADDDTARVSVRDGGAGIADDLRPIVFERYVSGRIDGTGIGLSMARQIAHDHGGDISLNSCPGSGTEVILALPLAACAGGSR